MKYKVDIVIGTNYGDEGKGLTTNVLTDENTLIVFASNSAQRSHTVVHNEKRHAFRCFGSGTFKGAATYYSDGYMPNPALFRQEWEELHKMGITPKVYINSSCLWVTPMDMYYNTIKSRGKTNTTGCGAWATICRDKYFEDLEINGYSGLVGDNSASDFSRAFDLKLIQEYYAKKVEEDMDIWFYHGKYLCSNIENDFNFMIKHSTIVHEHSGEVKELLRSYNHIIFENSQGLMLDPRFGGIEFTTPALVGCDAPVKILNKYFAPEEIKLNVYYITRTYLTRHGDGPIDGIECEVSAIKSGFIDYTNVYNDFQGTIRYGYFTKDALQRLAERMNKDYCSTKTFPHRHMNIVITHKNIVDIDSRWIDTIFKSCQIEGAFVSDNEKNFKYCSLKTLLF